MLIAPCASMKVKILFDSLHRIMTSVHLLNISICAPNMRGGGPPVKKNYIYYFRVDNRD